MFNINAFKNERHSPQRGWAHMSIQPLQTEGIAAGSYPPVKAQGTLSIPVNPINGETITIGSRVYTFQDTLTNSDGNVKIGGSAIETQANLVAAVNLIGTPGTQYALATKVNEDVTIDTFVGNNAVVTAKTAGVVGNSIATTETMAGAGNQFNGVTLGTTRAGAEATTPDFLLRTIWDYDANNSGWAMPNPSKLNNENYTGRTSKPCNPFVDLNGFLKIVFPDNYGSKVKRLNSLLLSVMHKRFEQTTLTGLVANGSNNIYKMIEVDSTRGLLLFHDAAASLTKVVVFSVASDGALTFGVPASIGFSNGIEECDVVMVNTDKALLSYKGTGLDIYTASISITGTSCAVNSGVVFTAVDLAQSRLIQLDVDKALLAWKPATAADPQIVVVSLTGTVPGYGTGVVLTGCTQVIPVANGANKYQIFYANGGAMWTAAGTVSAATISNGVAFRVTNSQVAGGLNEHRGIQVAADRIMYITDDEDGEFSGGANLFLISVSGTTSTVPYRTRSGISQNNYLHWIVPLGSNKYWFANDTQMNLIEYDPVRNRLNPRGYYAARTIASGEDAYSNDVSYRIQGGHTYGKVGNFAIHFGIERSPRYMPMYSVWPLSANVELYLNDEYKKTISYDYPFGCGLLFPMLDVDDYGMNLKIKNPLPNAAIMYPGRYYTMIEV
ncbi:MAG: hypothetical protein AB203_01840 [Parcubacteria bacterium C7867-008]|nr:MAG: hypothetical protein AB203_01840 [Parcubacteria bacterium C7867-008]